MDLKRMRRAVGLILVGVAVIGLALALARVIGSHASAQSTPHSPASPLAAQRPDKQARLDQWLATSAATPAPKNPNYQPSPSRGEPWPQGIFDNFQAPWAKGRFILKNVWQGDRGSQHLQVYGGAEADDPAQSVVVVVATSFDLSSKSLDSYRAPRKAGPLRVTAANVDRLTLAAPDGTQFTFDVASRTFAAP